MIFWCWQLTIICLKLRLMIVFYDLFSSITKLHSYLMRSVSNRSSRCFTGDEWALKTLVRIAKSYQVMTVWHVLLSAACWVSLFALWQLLLRELICVDVHKWASKWVNTLSEVISVDLAVMTGSPSRTLLDLRLLVEKLPACFLGSSRSIPTNKSCVKLLGLSVRTLNSNSTLSAGD